ncbi:hypothetical protein [Pseudomonas sp. NFX1]|uniref:hypothetical protein n=1 Tax=Pseudomonas sp. NFX1 TaxID=2201355 RepID=UPI003DA76E81
MIKIVPDPPRPLIHTPYFSIHSDISPHDALTQARELIRAVAQTIDEHCRAHAGEPDLSRLAHTAQAAESAAILLQHASERMSAEGKSHER